VRLLSPACLSSRLSHAKLPLTLFPPRQAYSLVAQTILENPVPSPTSATPEGGAAPSPSASASIRLLISHLLIGSVIGKGGSKIRQIQELASARMVASKEMLPQSTERIVEVTGQPEGVRIAVQEIAKCLIDDWDRSQGTVLYHPGAEGLGGAGAVGAQGHQVPQQQQQQQGNGAYPQQQQGGAFAGAGQPRQPRAPMGGGAPGQQGQQQQQQQQGFRNGGGAQGGAGGARRQGGAGAAAGGAPGAAAGAAQGQFAPGQSLAGTVVGNESDPNWREQKISIPSDMVYVLFSRARSSSFASSDADLVDDVRAVAASSAVAAPRSTRSVACRARASTSPRRRTTRRASACSSSRASPSASSSLPLSLSPSLPLSLSPSLPLSLSPSLPLSLSPSLDESVH